MRPVPGHDLRDPAAFARAYGQHARSVHNTAMAILNDPAAAHDVVHDVFLRLWRRPEAFDAARGGLGPYLRLMARSRALDLKRDARAADRAHERLRLVVDRAAHDEPATAAAIRRRDLLTALDALPAGQREAVLLAYWGDLTAAEISDLAGLPLGTVKSRVRLGLTRLRETYGVARAA